MSTQIYNLTHFLLSLGLLLTLVIFWISLRDLENDTVRIYDAIVICLSEGGRSLDGRHPGAARRPRLHSCSTSLLCRPTTPHLSSAHSSPYFPIDGSREWWWLPRAAKTRRFLVYYCKAMCVYSLSNCYLLYLRIVFTYCVYTTGVN